MNILVINGSPKGENSNTLKLTRAFLEGTGWGAGELEKRQWKSFPNPYIPAGCLKRWRMLPGASVRIANIRLIWSLLTAVGPD